MTELVTGCVVCGLCEEKTRHTVREAMFGLDEKFSYDECRSCGSLQIADVPDDLARYYDSDAYYSFKLHEAIPAATWRQRLMKSKYAGHARRRLGRVAPWIAAANLKSRDHVLDIGCGSGRNLGWLYEAGIRNLTGADPFLLQDQLLYPKVPLLKKNHEEISGNFDWVMLHHTFEHVPDPRALLSSCKRLLSPGGRVLIRMPLMQTAAWRTYGTDWVQIDAPRHLVVYSLRGFAELAESVGFEIQKVVFDSTGFQFAGSELVRAGVPHATDFTQQFSCEQLRAWDIAAERLNRSLDGDQACIIIREQGAVRDRTINLPQELALPHESATV